MSFKLKFSLLVGSLVLSLLILAVIGSFNVMSTAGKADILSGLVNDEINNEIDGLQGALLFLLKADSDLHKAVIAEKLALSAASDEEIQQVDTDNSESARRAFDSFKAASEQFDSDELKQLYAQFVEKYNLWIEKTRNVIENVKDQSKYQFARRISAGSARSTFNDMRAVVDELVGAVQNHIGELRLQLRSNEEQVRNIADELIASSGSVAVVVVVLELLLGVGAALFAIIFGRKSFRMIAHVINELNEQSQKVSYISKQFKSSSEQISSGASEQASSLEEISSSLEEMASMTQQSTHNVHEARKLAAEAHTAAEDGQDAMREMIGAIDAIKTSADETAKIVKTIDEIAFQTNLLALNAAVEAARAGEAGKGFAVVAEEVRNLAQRSAEAARVTTELIEGSKKNTDNGVSVSRNVEKRLTDIATAVGKANGLIAEIASASEEQASGIRQINDAVSNMDKVTQQNAAGAEESSSASTELSSQAVHMENIVGHLAHIISGSSNSEETQQVTIAPERKRLARIPQPQARHVERKTASRAIAPETIIPLDDEDLSDF